MYQSTSSSSSSQKSMSNAGVGAGTPGGGGGGGGLTRYGSAPGSLLTSAVDSVIGNRQPDSAASFRTPPSFGGHYFSSAESSVVDSSQKVVQSSSAAAAALHRSYGLNDLALGDYSTVRNGGQFSSSSPLVRQRSSPAGFLSHIAVAEGTGGFSLTSGGGGGIGRLKSQLSFNNGGQDNNNNNNNNNNCMSQFSEMISESVVVNNNNNNNNNNNGNNGFGMDSNWDTSNSNSIAFSAPHSKRSKHHSDGDQFFNCLTALESQPATNKSGNGNCGEAASNSRRLCSL